MADVLKPKQYTMEFKSDDPTTYPSHEDQQKNMLLDLMDKRAEDIASLKTMDPRLSKMSWLVKHSNNPDGIDAEKLMKMSDEEILIAYDKWSEKNKK